MITPQDAAKKNDANRAAMLQAAEKRVDELLACSFCTGGAVSIDGRELAVLREYRDLRKTLFDRYREAGWEIKTHDDQRDGLSFTFSAKSEPKFLGG